MPAQTSARQAARSAATSARACSEACSVFFAPQAKPGQAPADRRGTDPHTPALGQARAILRQHRVILLRHQRGQNLRVGSTQGTPPATMGTWPAATFPAGNPHPATNRADADTETRRQFAQVALARLMGLERPLTQIR